MMSKDRLLVALKTFLILLIIFTLSGCTIEKIARYIDQYIDIGIEDERKITWTTEHWDVILVNKYPSEKCWRTAHSFSSFSSKEEAIKFGMEAVNDKKYFTRDLWYPSIEIEHGYLYGKNCEATTDSLFCEVICSPIQCIEDKRKFGTVLTCVKDLYCNPNFIH